LATINQFQNIWRWTRI